MRLLIAKETVQGTFLCKASVDAPVEMGRSSADAKVWLKNLAECSARFSSVTCDYSAELRQTFSVICGLAFASFCARRWR